MQKREGEGSDAKVDKDAIDLSSTNAASNTGLPHDTAMSAIRSSEGEQNIPFKKEHEKATADVPNKHSVSNERQIVRDLRIGVYRLAKLWIKLLTVLAGTIFAGVLSLVTGFGSWAPSPVLDLVQRYPSASVVIASLFTLISLLAWFISREPAPKDDVAQPKRNFSQHSRRLVIATITSTTSSMLCFTLLAVVLIRPPWCPSLLCPAPKLVLNPNGIHDDNIEFYPQTIQSPFYMIPGNPASYTLRDLPKDTSALRIDDSTQSPYRVVLGIHSLQQGQFGLIIEQVHLVVKQVSLAPYPLRVWTDGKQRDFRSNIFQVFYSGQEAGVSILAVYSSQPYGHVQLVPGEADELDLQVDPHMKVGVDLHFQVQIAYYVPSKSQLHILTLPRIFEVVFSNQSNWYQYHLHDGHFVAGP